MEQVDAFNFHLKEIPKNAFSSLPSGNFFKIFLSGRYVQDVPKLSLRCIWVTYSFSNFIVLNKRVCLKQIVGACWGWS